MTECIKINVPEMDWPNFSAILGQSIKGML